MNDTFAALVEHHPEAGSVVIGKSSEGRNIPALRIRVGSRSARKRVLLVGCHHAAEWITVEIALRLATSVLDGTSGIPGDLLEDIEFWSVPMLNPDGHSFAVQYAREWRTSRSARHTAEGLLTYGVDLNRNYSVGFGVGGVSSPYPGSALYRGPAPFSEPETAALRDLCCAEKFDGILSFHAHGRQILYPWAHLFPGESGREVEPLRERAEIMAAAIRGQGGNYEVKQASQHYDLALGGDFCDWAFDTFRKPALTLELGTSRFEMRLPSALIAETHAEIRGGFAAFVANI